MQDGKYNGYKVYYIYCMYGVVEMSIIQTYSLTKKFNNLVAVDSINLEVEEGEVLGLLGPNGAGKTTTIRMLTGIVSPTSGYALVSGKRTDTEVEQLHEVIGLLTETPGFYDRLSARRNLEFYAGFYPLVDAEDKIDKYLKVMGLWQRQRDKVGTFSKGMKQRLALVRALLHEPKILFLDEPTAGLDPEAAGEVRQLIKRLSDEGKTILLATHNLNEAELLCHRIAVIRTRLLALDTPENFRQRLFRRHVIVRLESVEGPVIEAVNRLEFVKGVRLEGNQLSLELDDPDKNLPALVKSLVDAGGKVSGVSEEQHSLEDIYLSLIREGESGDK